MKQYFIILSTAILAVCLLLGHPAAAQDTTSQFLTENFGRSYRYYAGEVISQPLLPAKQYAVLEGGYRYASGSYRTAQQAPRQSELFFYTEGAKQIKKYTVSGFFSYRFVHQDSVAYSLLGSDPNPTPYYFYAAGKGNWVGSQYRMQGIVSRHWLNDRLTAGAGASYAAGNLWRESDPRAEFFSYDLQVLGTVHYSILPRHTIGIAGGIVRSQTSDGIEYRNVDYEKSELYPAYKTYLQYGYGYLQLISGDRYISNTGKGYTVQGIYNGRLDQWQLTAKGAYTYRQTGMGRRGDNQSPDIYLGSYFEDITRVDARAQYRQGRNNWSADISYLYHLGRDKHAILNGNNYVYALEQVQVNPLYARMENHTMKYELGAQLSLSNLFKADGAGGQKINYQYAGAGITSALYHYSSVANRFWKALLRLDAQLPLDPQLTTSMQQTDFVKNVIWYDYYYYNATSVTATAEWLYRLPIQKTNTFFKLSGQYQQASVKKDDTYLTGSKPGNNRWYIQGSIGISL